MLDPDPHQSQNSGTVELKMESWRVLDAHNGGVKYQNGAVGLYLPVVADLHHRNEKQDPDPH
jgi:hypothetical protein